MTDAATISVHSSVGDYRGFDHNVEENIKGLARTMTGDGDDEHPNPAARARSLELVRTMSQMSQVPGVETFTGDIDPRLDPSSEQFEARFWVKNLQKLMNSDPEYYKPTSLGIGYRNLVASGVATDADYQSTVLNAPVKLGRFLYDLVTPRDKSREFDILKPMDALIEPGTVTVVLGRPGAGCSTLLKTISAQTYGFHVGEDSQISYDGLSQKDIANHYRGEVTFSAESDVHFPHLSVGQTLEFASTLRTPQNRTPGVTRKQYAQHMMDVYMAMYGLSHTKNTKVGNELVRGVSGGERKRVSIAEVSLAGSSLQCWDNATRGLDAATALEFIRAIKTSAVVSDTTSLIAIYQCSQDAYDLFDNVVVLYEGYQIYFGPAEKAKKYFLDMGYECPPRQTTADYLTSVTSPAERIAKPGFEGKVPQTPAEFSEYWRNSPEYAELVTRVDQYLDNTKSGGTSQQFEIAHKARQAKHTRGGSSFRASYFMQIRSLMRRNLQRTKGDPSITLFGVIGNSIMGLIISSLFYNLDQTTSSLYYRGAAMFFAVLFNAFSSLLEIMLLFEARPIVEKHKQFAMYHPSADAFASVLTEIPPKLLTALSFNLVYYFMVNFRRNPGRFFFYFLINISATFSMSHLFRTVGAYFKSLPEAMTPASVLLLALTIFTGFTIPTPNMLGWSRWINYLNPVGYAFESLLLNELHGRDFECAQFVPSGGSYDDVSLTNRICSAVGSEAGSSILSGTRFVLESYDYRIGHKWRNLGIIIGFIIFFLFTYVVGVEYNRGAMQKGEMLLFQQATLRKLKKEKKLQDIEKGPEAAPPGDSQVADLVVGKDTFHWRDVCYEVKIKSETRRILNHVDGWVKPGTLTALMGASGAGKTTLLDVLANRVTMGVVTGSMFVSGHLRDPSFQRSTGYVQQQDLHLRTSTVREALRFSAYLRQPYSVPRSEKEEYVEKVIDILEMRRYADAIVGVAGEGLNVEQRKRLTIGVELAAKPQLLLFLDEPTSGLDSQTAWSICQLMRKLADNGQAVLCTIHQPSSLLIQEFDRLLFLQRGGKTVYFGNLGKNSSELISYFERHGAAKCPKEANPAEWMLEVIGAAPGSHANQDYHQVWMESAERAEVRRELMEMERNHHEKGTQENSGEESHAEFASPLWSQYLWVTRRVFEQYWRTPLYICSKAFLSISSSIFNGFSFFMADKSQQGLQNQMFSVFMFMVVINTLIQQMLPQYVFQRDLYEVRERPSKTFSWKAFILAQITVEVPWNFLMGTITYFCWYYPVGLWRNAEATDAVAERGAYMWLMITAWYVYSGTLGQACVAGMEIADNAANLAMLLFTLSLTFCGVLMYPSGFWIFMYRVSPGTYWVAGVLSAAVADTNVVCSARELLQFPPPSGETCGSYMQTYLDSAGGYLVDENATDMCQLCPMALTNDFLQGIHVNPSQKWRDWGIFICFIAINCLFTLFFYWLARVPKNKKEVAEPVESENSSSAEEK